MVKLQEGIQDYDQTAENHWVIKLLKSKCEVPEYENETVYGLAFCTDEGGGEVAIRDISSHKAEVEELIARCLANGVTPVSILDILEDFLE